METRVQHTKEQTSLQDRKRQPLMFQIVSMCRQSCSSSTKTQLETRPIDTNRPTRKRGLRHNATRNKYQRTERTYEMENDTDMRTVNAKTEGNSCNDDDTTSR